MGKRGRPPNKLDRYPNRIRELREAHGLTLKALAKIVGDINPGLIGQYERGTAQPSLRRLEMIAAAFGVPAYTLLIPSQPSGETRPSA